VVFSLHRAGEGGAGVGGSSRVLPVGGLGRTARWGAGTVLLLAAITGCSSADIEDKLRFGWPRGVTEQGEQMRVLWTWSSVAALAVGVVVWGLIFWCVIVYRRRGAELPRQTKYNLPIEALYTVAPFLVVAVLFYYTAVTQNDVTRLTNNPDTTVGVNAFKWNWQFDYNDRRDPQTNEFVNTVGSATEVPVLVIPEGQRIRVVLRSNDVVHSFWVPEFLFKMDVFPPGQLNQFEFTATEQGSYVGRCAELCGTYHSAMNFEVRIVSGEDYEAYLDALAGIGNVDPDRQAKALSAIGQPPQATTTHPFDTDRAAREATERQRQD
jgi:cytochrome c oxidase subunit II